MYIYYHIFIYSYMHLVIYIYMYIHDGNMEETESCHAKKSSYLHGVSLTETHVVAKTHLTRRLHRRPQHREKYYHLYNIYTHTLNTCFIMVHFGA